MAEAEFWKQKDDAGGGLRDQVHGVRLEVQKFRTEMTDQVGGVRLEVEKVRTEVARTETRLVEKIGGVESRLIQGMTKWTQGCPIGWTGWREASAGGW